MAAAVADYRPKRTESRKMKRTGEAMTVELIPNPDILAELGERYSGPGKRPLCRPRRRVCPHSNGRFPLNVAAA
jgi:hypothetical protein